MSQRTITHNGETLTIVEWSKRIGVSKQTISYRLNVGWPIAEALSKPRSRSGRSSNADAITDERARNERKHKAEFAKLQRHFIALAHDIDRTLTAFNNRLLLLTGQEDRGAGLSPYESTDDRPPRVSETCG